MTTVLITGAGAPGAPGIIKSLKKENFRVVGVDARKDAVGCILADEFDVIPRAQEPNYVDSLLAKAEAFKVDVILPLNTAELLKLARSKDRFRDIKISISSPESLEKANNKAVLMDLAKKNNIPVPEFYLVRSYEDFEKAVFKLGYPKNKVCFKPPVSNGLRGFRILSEETDRLSLLIKEKPNDVFTRLEYIKPILENAKPFPELLVMDYLPGKEYSCDVLVNQGSPLVVIPRERKELKMGISFVAETIEDKEIISYSEKTASLLKLNGVVGFQFKRNKEGVPCLIESNPRLQGTVVLSVQAGANLPCLAVKMALGEKIEKPEVRWGVKMIRYWDEVYL